MAAPADTFLPIWHLSESFESFGRTGASGTARPQESGGGYRFSLAENQFLHLIVDQQGIDLVVQVYQETEGLILEIDSSPGAEGVENIFVVSERPRDLILRAFAGPEAAGHSFGARVEELGPASEANRRRAQAAASFSEARLASLGRRDASERETIADFLEAANLWRSGSDLDRAAEAYFELGNFARELRFLEEASTAYKEAAELFHIVSNNYFAARSWHELGRVSKETRNLELAAESLQHSLGYWRQSGNRKEENTVLHDLATVWNSQGEFHAAIDAFEQCIAYYQETDSRSYEAIARTSFSYLYLQLGDRRQAAIQSRLAIRLLEGLGQYQNTALALLRLAEARLHLEGPDAAFPHLYKALALYKETGNAGGQALANVSLGNAFRIAQRPREAVDALRSAREYYRNAQNPRGEASVAASLAAAYESLGQMPLARETNQEALALAEGTNAPSLVPGILWRLARVEDSLGNTQAALTHLERAIALLEKLRQQPRRLDQRSSFLSIRQGLYQTAARLVLESPLTDSTEQQVRRALDYAEQSRSRGLIDQLQHLSSESADPTRLAPLENGLSTELARQINALHLDRLAAQALGRDHREVSEHLQILLEKYHQSQARDRARAAGALQPPPTSWDSLAIQTELLDSETLLLVYFLAEKRSFLFAVTREQISVYDLPEIGVVDSVVEDARTRLLEPPSRFGEHGLRRALEDSTRVLLEPVSNELAQFSRVIIVPSGSLKSFPFSSLPNPNDRTEPWIVQHELVFSPSASALGELRETHARRVPGSGFAVLADPAYLPFKIGSAERPELRIRRLANSGHEADSILRLSPPPPVLDARRFQASLKLVQDGTLTGFRFIHFAVHGLYEEDLPDLSALVLSTVDEEGRPRDGLLRAYELRTQRLSAELVTLSACNSARGEDLQGEAVTGLARGFFSAGAAGVLMSVTPVHDEASAELMTRFYRHLIEDRETASRSLHLALRSMWRDSRWHHPHFWSSFVYYGDWRRHQQVRSSSQE
ncbi:MAG: CHAT domain-containing protein [bacterium]|nr:CHAT domain-containing protein [bacterium]